MQVEASGALLDMRNQSGFFSIKAWNVAADGIRGVKLGSMMAASLSCSQTTTMSSLCEGRNFWHHH